MHQPLLSLLNVQIRNGLMAENDRVSLKIFEGDCIALTGDNEALNSGLLNVLAGQTTVQSGTKTIYPMLLQNKTVYDTAKEVYRPLAMLVSARHHFKNVSNTSNFYYQQRFNSMDANNALTVAAYLAVRAANPNGTLAVIDDLVSDLKLASLLDKELIKLSNGETRRVLIAAALLASPQLLLLHNPMAGLDTVSRQQITALISKLANQSLAIVLTCSPFKLPAGVTSVGVANVGKPWLYTPVQNFNAAKHKPVQIAINQPLLISLWNQTETPLFDTMVQMKNVNIRYGDKVLLNNINWTIKQGERWALQGPNGAGKSTLLSLITGDNPQAFANNITLFDRRKGSGESIWEIKQKIGFFSPELYQYFPLHTIAVHAVLSGMYDTIGLSKQVSAANRNNALHWMEIFNIAAVSHLPLFQLSPVQQRMCLVARAMIKCPSMLILDEPCHGFDQPQKEWLKKLVDTICYNSKTTLIFVSHYPYEIPGCVNQYFVLNQGQQV